MPARYIHEGRAIDYNPADPVKAGDAVVLDQLFGIAKLDIPINTLGALHVSGVFDIPKIAGTAIPIGSKVYWNSAQKHATPDDDNGNNLYIGKAILAAADAEELVRVRLDQ